MQLEKIYKAHTDLKLRTINSGHSYTWIKNTLQSCGQVTSMA